MNSSHGLRPREDASEEKTTTIAFNLKEQSISLMAIYSQPTSAELNEIAEVYGLGKITALQPFAQGQENSNFRLGTQSGQYVLTICENKSPAEAQTLIDTLLHLAAHGFHTTKIVPTQDGAMQSEFNGKPLLLKTYLSGQVIDPLPLATMEPLGQAMARLHQVPIPDFLPGRLAYGRETFGPMPREFGRPHPFLDWLKGIEQYLEDHLPASLPRALIHADIFADNVIIDPKHGPVIMDFEEAANYYRVFDLGMAIVGTCYPGGQLNERARSALLQGYELVNPLTSAEVKTLPAATVYAAAAMASWRFWQFNVVQPEVGKRDHYRALQKIAEELRQEAS